MLAKTPLHETIDRAMLAPWRQRLLAGADYMELHGQAKWSTRDDEGQVCIIGSLFFAGVHGHNAGTKIVGSFKATEQLECFTGKPVIEFNVENDAPTVVSAMRQCALAGLGEEPS